MITYLDEPKKKSKITYLDEPSATVDGKQTPVKKSYSAYGGSEGFKRLAFGGGSGYFSEPGSEDVLPAVGQIIGGTTPAGYFGSVGGAAMGQAARQGIRALRGQPASLGEINKEMLGTATGEAIFRGVPRALFPKQFGGKARELAGKKIGELISKVEGNSPFTRIAKNPIVSQIDEALNQSMFERGPARTALISKKRILAPKGSSQFSGSYTKEPTGDFLYTTPNKNYAKNFGSEINEYTISPKKNIDFSNYSENEISHSELKNILKEKGVDISGIVKDEYKSGVKEPIWFWMRRYRDIPKKIKESGYDSVSLMESIGKSKIKNPSTLVLDKTIASHSGLKFSEAIDLERQLGREGQFATEATQGRFAKAPSAPRLNQGIKDVRRFVSAKVDEAASQAGVPEFEGASKTFGKLASKYPEKELQKMYSPVGMFIRGTTAATAGALPMIFGGGFNPVVGALGGWYSLPPKIRTMIFRKAVDTPIGRGIGRSATVLANEIARKGYGN